MNKIYFTTMRGRRQENEDRHNIITNINGKDQSKAKVNFFGVYDGHGGSFVSKFLEKNLPNFFIDARVKYPLTNKYIHGIYKYLDHVLKSKYKKFAQHCGSTCLVAAHFRYKEDDYINILNTGDCRAVLCRDGIATPLMKDHKPHWPEEKVRIENLGGRVEIDSTGTDFRIKDLSVSRAFGDFDAEPYLISTPDIYRYKIDKRYDKFLVLACDGVWDVLQNHDVVNFINNECYESDMKTRKNVDIAKKLGEYALVKGSTDNLTIIIIFF